MYSSTLSLTWVQDETGGQNHTPSALPPGNTRYPLHRWQGGRQSRSGLVGQISPPPPSGFDPRTVQSVVSRYTDWAIPAHIVLRIFCSKKSMTQLLSFIMLDTPSPCISCGTGTSSAATRLTVGYYITQTCGYVFQTATSSSSSSCRFNT